MGPRAHSLRTLRAQVSGAPASVVDAPVCARWQRAPGPRLLDIERSPPSHHSLQHSWRVLAQASVLPGSEGSPVSGLTSTSRRPPDVGPR
eukprot:2011619-Alexandrium_andersonii.AAC.1